MPDKYSHLNRRASVALHHRNWSELETIAGEILSIDPSNAHGYFLSGLAKNATKQLKEATRAFEKALKFDANRFDAAVELANRYSFARRNGEAAALLSKHESALGRSPRYLNAAGAIYTSIGMPEKAWPLFLKAVELQPDADLFKANLATCAVYLGKIERAVEIYRDLLTRRPDHRKNHYELSRLSKAKDREHVHEMERILATDKKPPSQNIFMYFALGKELEDLGDWDASFDYYRMANDTAARVSGHDVASDIELIERIISVCSSDWLEEGCPKSDSGMPHRTPIFITGLPRTGTTLTERILSSHSQVSSLGETLFLQMHLRRLSGVSTLEQMTPEMIDALADRDLGSLAQQYTESVGYRLGSEPIFIDKLPLNFLYLGFVAKAWPSARMVHLVRNPMDACFSMYKQVFTWAYKFSYSLDDLGRYYVAYDRLRRHWQSLLGDRLIEVQYESLVTDQEGQTRHLLDRLGLEFEPACLDFEKNTAPSATASSVQVRSKIHSGSIGRWKRFETQLQPLRDRLVNAGIAID